MNTILKLSFASVLFFGLASHQAHAGACAEGVPEGSLETQIQFLLACEPASGPSAQAPQARQEGNGASQSGGQSGSIGRAGEGAGSGVIHDARNEGAADPSTGA